MAKKPPKISDQELADARLMVALEILESENAKNILDAMHHLAILQSTKAIHLRKKGGKKNKNAAYRWLHSGDELFTVVMCAIYQSEDARAEGDADEV